MRKYEEPCNFRFYPLIQNILAKKIVFHYITFLGKERHNIDDYFILKYFQQNKDPYQIK